MENNIEDINQMQNIMILEKIKNLLINEDHKGLSKFILPWKYAQMKFPKNKGQTLYKSTGKYFEFLRWLAFKIVKDNQFIDYNTISILQFLEEEAITGIFNIKPPELYEKGQLFKLLKKQEEFIYDNKKKIVTLSNTQLVEYLINKLKVNNVNDQTGGKKKFKINSKKIQKTKKTKKNKKK